MAVAPVVPLAVRVWRHQFPKALAEAVEVSKSAFKRMTCRHRWWWWWQCVLPTIEQHEEGVSGTPMFVVTRKPVITLPGLGHITSFVATQSPFGFPTRVERNRVRGLERIGGASLCVGLTGRDVTPGPVRQQGNGVAADCVSLRGKVRVNPQRTRETREKGRQVLRLVP